MKQTLEYIILNYLIKNRTSGFEDISHLYNDDKLLYSVILELSKRDFIEFRKYEGKAIRGNLGHVQVVDSEKPPKCKIKFLGIEYVRKINSDSINHALNEKTLKQFPMTKWFAIISFIIALLLGLKELYILWKTL